MIGRCKHRNTQHSIYIPTEIHTQLNSYGVSGCSVWLCVVFNEYSITGGTRAEYLSRLLVMHGRR